MTRTAIAPQDMAAKSLFHNKIEIGNEKYSSDCTAEMIALLASIISTTEKTSDVKGGKDKRQDKLGSYCTNLSVDCNTTLCYLR